MARAWRMPVRNSVQERARSPSRRGAVSNSAEKARAVMTQFTVRSIRSQYIGSRTLIYQCNYLCLAHIPNALFHDVVNRRFNTAWLERAGEPAEGRSGRRLRTDVARELEATSGIEPEYTVLQTVA